MSENHPEAADPRAAYARDRYVPMPGLLSKELVDHVVAYANILGSIDQFESEERNGNAIGLYGAAGFDALLVSLLGVVTQVVGAPVVPTYSFARVYFEGDELRRHRDRPACEHSVTLHLDSSGGAWPVEFERIDGTVASLLLEPGDGVMYRGIELPHWRGPCPVEWYLQLFLHWVELDGAHGAEAMDRRQALGTPSPREPARYGR